MIYRSNGLRPAGNNGPNPPFHGVRITEAEMIEELQQDKDRLEKRICLLDSELRRERHNARLSFRENEGLQRQLAEANLRAANAEMMVREFVQGVGR